MSKQPELYNEEIKNLKRFRSKIETHAIYKEDLEGFSDEYEELVAQVKVITRVSDRLQKKLDKANTQIKGQNDEIKEKNDKLSETIGLLAQAKVGKKASRIILGIGISIFILEQLVLEPIVDAYISQNTYVKTLILIIPFFFVKAFEGRLEKYYLNQRKKKILKQEEGEEENTKNAA